jgi:2,3-dihydroxy-p-cumate/2,3-dihydroxybenzoate 3,4-dioxygenase
MPIAIEQLRYVVLGTRDPEAARRFAVAELGLQVVNESADEIALRSDERQYSVVLSKDEARRQAVGLEVRDDATLAAAAAALEARGIALVRDPALASRRNVRALAAFTTPGGVRIELVVRPQNQAWRFFPARDAGITGLVAVSLRSTDVAADEALLTDVFGLRVADWVGDAAYLGFDSAHHRLALHPAARAGVLAVEFGVEGINQVMQQFYRLRPEPDAIVHGPGRRPVSAQVFLTFQGPDDVLYAFVAEGTPVDPAAPPRPRQFADGPASHCAWGSECRVPELDGRAVAPARPALRGVPRP